MCPLTSVGQRGRVEARLTAENTENEESSRQWFSPLSASPALSGLKMTATRGTGRALAKPQRCKEGRPLNTPRLCALARENRIRLVQKSGLPRPDFHRLRVCEAHERLRLVPQRLRGHRRREFLVDSWGARGYSTVEKVSAFAGGVRCPVGD